nr:Toll-like receptor 5 [Arenicola marina]
MGHVMKQVFLAACTVTLYLTSDGAIDRKDGSNVTSPLMALLAPLTSPVPGPYYSCPFSCTCLSLTEDYSVTCHGGRIDDVIRTLPVETTKLKYTVSRFKESNIEFTHLSRLTSLELTNEDLTRYEDSDVITRGDIFQGLGELRQLRIHLNLKYINETALAPLTALTTLDLSHTRSLDKGNIRKLLSALRTFKIKLQDLSIRNFQRPNPHSYPATIDIRKDIVKHLDGIPLTHLDIGGNGITRYNPSLTQFLPGLQVFNNLGNEGRNDRPYWMCSIMDIFFHPSLRTLSIGEKDLGLRGTSSRRQGGRLNINTLTDMFQARLNPCYNATAWKPFANMSDTHPVCQMVACMCSKYTIFPCEHVPKTQDILDFNRRDCNSLTIPMAPKLEELQLINERSMVFSYFPSWVPNSTLCWGKKISVKYLSIYFTSLGPGLAFDFPRFQGLEEAWYVNIQGNRAAVHLGAFAREFPKLKRLLVGRNKLQFKVDETEPFLGNPALQSLDLEECELTDLDHLGLSSLRYLETLNISWNSLRIFDVNISDLTDLRLLNLSNNRLACLPDHVTSALDSVAERHDVVLDLLGNSLICGCSYLTFLKWLTTTRVTLSNRDFLQCIHPTHGRVDMSASILRELKDSCEHSHWLLIVLTVLGTCGCFAVISLIVALYRKRWAIRFYIHAARRSWSREIRKRKHAEEPIFPYDAFIVYSSEDRRWVHDVLRTTLEEEHQLRLCIHFRDFIPGHDIEDTIVESIDQSRKTILIMSPNFLQSDWCHFEFKMARQKIVLEGRDVLILVILEELPAAGLSRTLVRLLQTKTYLKWTESEAGQQLFWQQLVDAIKEDPANDP